jgi:hypothetical protein
MACHGPCEPNYPPPAELLLYYHHRARQAGHQWPAPKPLSPDCLLPNNPKPELVDQMRDVEREAVKEEPKPVKEEGEVWLLHLGWTVTMPERKVLQESAPGENNPVVDEELYVMQVLDEMDEEQQDMQNLEDLALPERLYQELRSYRLWECLKMQHAHAMA